MNSLNQNKIIQAYISENHFGKLIEAHFEIITKGEVFYFCEIKEKHLATPMAAHGGVLSTLCDASLGIAALSVVCELNKIVSTLEFSIKYLKPSFLGDKLIAKAEVLKTGKSIIFSETKIFNQKNELVCTAQGTFNVYESSKAGY